MDEDIARSVLPRRIESIDGLRGLFAISVMCGHLALWSGIVLSPWVLGLVNKLQIYAVAGFFVISGISMAHVYTTKSCIDNFDTQRFFLKRFLRLAPLYYAVSIIYFVQDCTESSGCNAGNFLDLLLNLSFTFGFYSPATTALPIGGWSVGMEWVYYLCFPLFIVLCRRGAGRSTLTWLLCCALIANGLMTWHVMPRLLMEEPSNDWWFFYAHAIVYFVYFMAGVAWVKWLEKIHLSPFAGFVGAVVVVLMFILTLPLNQYQSQVVSGLSGTVLMLATIMLVCFSVAIPLSAPLKRAATFLGNISYSSYLIHPLVFFGAKMALKIPPVWSALLAVIITPVAAHCIYHYFERPFMELGRDRQAVP